MKKTIIFSCLALFLYAQDDYVPLSELSNAKKIEYNFVDKKEKIEVPKIQEYKTTKVEEKEYESISEIEEVEFKEDIIENVSSSEKIKNIKEEKKVVNKEFVKEYKNDNILQDVKKNNIFNEDFSITPKLSYSFLKSDVFITDRVSVVEERGVLIPELSLSYKNHTLKAETMSSDAYFEGVLIGGGDFFTDTSWNKVSYLYKYKNANIGLAYNIFELKGNFMFNELGFDFFAEDKEEFPSLEVHMKNEENNIQTEYGVSYGKNNNLDYAYEYYIDLGYKIFKDNLVVSAGYKNKTIEIDGVRFQYKGPILTLGSTF
jgi:hypothetical protein